VRIAQNKPDDAVAIANQLLDAAKTPEAYLLRGRLQLRLQNNDSARADMLKAVELTTDKTRGWIIQTDFYQATNDIPQAIKASKRPWSVADDWR
jgi:predicted negative regulator of RcsB-dependent stress response